MPGMYQAPSGQLGRISNSQPYFSSNIGMLAGVGPMGFNPANLFANGEQGGWYDPSDFTTMFQDSAGTTPVTTVEQPVGLLLDKHTGLSFGPQVIANAADRNFTSDTGYWSKDSGVTISGGAANWNATAATFQLYNLTALSIGYYEVTFTITSFTAGGLTVKCGTSAGTITYNAPGTYKLRLSVPTTDGRIAFASVGASTTLSITGVSILPVTGNHLTQSTTTQRPILSARYNLLTKTDQFNDTSGWLKDNGTNNSTVVNNKFIPNNTAVGSYLDSNEIATVVGGIYRLVWRIAPAGFNFVQIAGDAVSGRIPGTAIIDLTTGNVTVTGGAMATAIAVGDGTGAYDITVTFGAATATGSRPFARPYVNGTTSATGDGVSGIQLYRADFRSTQDATLNIPAYQRVNTSTDYDTIGFPQYLKFDGVDDCLPSAAAFDMSNSDKVSVFVGSSKLASKSGSFVCELSAGSTANLGTFGLDVNGFSANGDWIGGCLNGSNGAYVIKDGATAAFPAGTSAVISMIANPAGGSPATDIILRQNGVDQGTGATAGTTTSGNLGSTYTLFVGARNGGSLALNGRLYPLIIRGSAITAGQITAAERYIGSKMGIAL